MNLTRFVIIWQVSSFVLWIALGVPTFTIWKDDIWWTNTMSWWANVATHGAGIVAAVADYHIQKRKNS